MKDPAQRTLAALIFLLTCNHAVLAGGRMAASLDALHRGASPAVVGVLMAAFGVVPMVCAFHLGKWIDRAGVARPMLVGTLCVEVGAALPFAFPGLPALFAAAPMMGFGFMLFQMAAQRATTDLGPDRAANYGLLSLGSSIAHVVGPLAAGLAIDHLGHRLAFAVLASLPLLPIVLLASGRLALPAGTPAPAADARRGWLDLIRLPALRRLFIVNTFVSIGWDVHTVFVPIYGSAIGLTGAQIGVIMAAFATATFVVRFGIRWILRFASENRVLGIALITAAAAYFSVPTTTNAGLLAALSFVLGLGLGAGQPTVMALLFANAPPGRMGEAVGVRMSLIHATAVVVPLVFGAIGSSLGLVAVFWGAGLCLGTGGLSARRKRR